MKKSIIARVAPAFASSFVGLSLLLLCACQTTDPTAARPASDTLSEPAAPLSPLEQARREDAQGDTLEAAIHNLRGTLSELSQRGDASAIRAVEAKIAEFQAASAAHHFRAEALRRGG